MDIKLKNKWIKALTSGKYRQGTGALKTYSKQAHKSKFCCLGVLCEVAGIKANNEGYGEFSYDGEYGSLSTSLLKKLKLKQEQESELIDMNDHYSNSFKEIAAWIKTNL
jgi:hypothetical protein